MGFVFFFINKEVIFLFERCVKFGCFIGKIFLNYRIGLKNKFKDFNLKLKLEYIFFIKFIGCEIFLFVESFIFIISLRLY